MKEQVTNKSHKYQKFKELMIKQSTPKGIDNFAFKIEKLISFVVLLDEIDKENIKFAEDKT